MSETETTSPPCVHISTVGLSIAGVCSCNYNVATAQGLPYQDASKGYSATSYQYIATSNGLTALVTIWICFRISGAFFNPAISLANYLAGTCNLTRTLVLLVSQLVGGIAGTAVTYGLFPSHCNASPALSPNTSLAQGVFIEVGPLFGLMCPIWLTRLPSCM